MRKGEAKLALAIGIRNAIVMDHPEKIHLDKVVETMNEKRITRAMLKATIRSGNAGFIMKDDPDGTKTEAMKAKVFDWIDKNISKDVGR